jgi:hypothetical protein
MRVRDAIWPLALAGLLVACRGTSPDPSASPSPEASAPVSASASASTSSTPATGVPVELVFRLASASDVQPLTPDLSVYADGRVLVIDEDGRLTQRVLSDDAIQALLDEVTASGWFSESHSVPLDLMPGVEQPALGPNADIFTLRSPDGTVVTVGNGMPHAGPPWWVRSEERDALAALADLLRSLAWVPAGAWLGEPEPYAATAFLLFSGFAEAGPDGPCPSGEPIAGCDRDVGTIAWPVAPQPEGFGLPFEAAGDDPGAGWDHCLLLGRGLAEAFETALDHPGLTTAVLGEGDAIPWVEREGWLDLWLRQLLPDETLTCEGKDAPLVSFR